MPKIVNDSRLLTKFPHIHPQQGENLNIEYNTKQIVTKCWYMFDTYEDIAKVTGLSTATLLRMRKKYHLPTRKILRYEGTVYSHSQSSTQSCSEEDKHQRYSDTYPDEQRGVEIRDIHG